MTKWSELQAWAFPQRWFRENLKLGEGGEEGLDNDIARATYERTGASVMGKRMFDGGELAWPEEAPFHTPVFVVTHTKRDPWERPGGTTFHFVNDGIESALLQAREAAGDRDVRIAGGAQTIQEYLDSGLIHLWVDAGYRSRGKEWVERELGLSVEVVHRTPKPSPEKTARIWAEEWSKEGWRIDWQRLLPREALRYCRGAG
jgi:dihydrofolate reductase